MKETSTRDKRYTIAVRASVYTKIRQLGRFGESFNDVLERFIESETKTTKPEGSK